MLTGKVKRLGDFLWLGIAFILLLLFIAITRFNGLYGQDSYEYLRYTKSLHAFFTSGANPGDYFWALIYPLCGAIVSFIFSATFSLQLISILSLLITGFYLEKIIIVLFNENKSFARLYITLFFILSPYILRASMVVMSDMLCVFFITAAIYHFLVYDRTISNKHFIGFVFFSVAAFMTRYAAAVILISPAIMAGYTFVRYFNWKIFLTAIVVVLLVTLPHFIVRRTNPMAFVQHQWVETWSVKNFFSKDFDTNDGHYTYSFFNVLYGFFNLIHPAFCFAGTILFVIAIRDFLKNIKTFPLQLGVIAVSVLCYALFLAGIPFQNMRFLILSFPLVLLLLFPAYKTLTGFLSSKVNKQLLIIGSVIVFAIQAGLFCRVFLPFYNDNKIEKQIAQAMLKHPNQTIYTFAIDMALQSYGVTNPIVNLEVVRLDTTTIAPGKKLVLFNEKQFAHEFKDKNPMLNWRFLNNKYHLNKIENLPADWGLYETR